MAINSHAHKIAPSLRRIAQTSNGKSQIGRSKTIMIHMVMECIEIKALSSMENRTIEGKSILSLMIDSLLMILIQLSMTDWSRLERETTVSAMMIKIEEISITWII